MTPPALAALLDACPDGSDPEAARRWCSEFDREIDQRNDRWLEDLAEFMNGKEVDDGKNSE